jgi:hypothetical protein
MADLRPLGRRQAQVFQIPSVLTGSIVQALRRALLTKALFKATDPESYRGYLPGFRRAPVNPSLDFLAA